MRRISLLLVLSLFSCETNRIRATVGELAVSPRALDFEQAFVGFPVRRTVTIQNRARAERTVRLVTAAPFSAPERVVLTGGAELIVEVVLDPVEAGQLTGTLSVGDDTETFVVELAGTVVLPPSCGAGLCEVSVFDPVLGRCVASQASDGTACADACVTGTCSGGRCVGSAVSCDDANPCTIDACEAAGGCQHRPLECASPTNPCKAARCDLSAGCVEDDVRDGTRCGPSDCVTANVCVLGECKPRPAPDGSACGATSFCQAAGTCQQSVCVQPAPTPLNLEWSYDFSGPVWNYRGVTDSAQNLYWLECTTADCSATSYSAGGALRFRTPIAAEPTERLHHLLVGDQLIYAANETLGGVATIDGAPLWSMPLSLNPPGAPDVADGQRITALAASPASIIVAVSRTEGQTPRRSYVFSVDPLTRSLGFARFFEGGLSAPVLDEQGNVFFLVSPPGFSNPPPRYLVSLSTSGVERWRQSAPVSMPWSLDEPIATFNGELLLDGGEVRSTVDGAERVATPAGDLLSNPLMGTAGRLWLRAVQAAQRIDAFSTRPGFTQPAWETEVTQLHGANLVSGTVAVEGGGLIVAVGDARHPTYLKAIGPQGEPRFSCEIVGMQSGGSLALMASLLENRWVALDDRYQTAPRLTVYEVPGERPALHGWVKATGSPAGNRRPLP
jgi:hypothetical protein